MKQSGVWLSSDYSRLAFVREFSLTAAIIGLLFGILPDSFVCHATRHVRVTLIGLGAVLQSNASLFNRSQKLLGNLPTVNENKSKPQLIFIAYVACFFWAIPESKSSGLRLLKMLT